MSSFQLSVAPSQISPLPFPTAPLHLSYSLYTDTLAVLHTNGEIEIWALGTRLLPPPLPRGKNYQIAQPTRIWQGFFASEATSSLVPRRIVMWQKSRSDSAPNSGDQGEPIDDNWIVAVLASSVTPSTGISKDVICLTYADGSKSVISLPNGSSSVGTGTMISTMHQLWFQSAHGELHQCTLHYALSTKDMSHAHPLCYISG